MVGITLQLLAVAIMVAGVSAGKPCHRPARLNHLQALGTRKSYHLAPPAKALDFLKELDQALGDNQGSDTDLATDVNFSQQSIVSQLGTQLVRHLEFDLWYDPNKDLYEDPMALNMPDTSKLADFAKEDSKASDTGDEADGGKRRGANKMDFKVMNIPDFDVYSNCGSFKECLQQVRYWSNWNPNHPPIVIRLNPRESDLSAMLPETMSEPLRDYLNSADLLRTDPQEKPKKIDSLELWWMESVISCIIPRSKLITPDDVRGDWPTLREALSYQGWPLVKDNLGKVMFTLSPKFRTVYLENNPTLRGRLFFTTAEDTGDFDLANMPDVGFIRVLDPRNTDIRSLVNQNYMVETLVDRALADGSADPRGSLVDVIAAGSHFITTVFPGPRAADQNTKGQFYEVRFSPSCNFATHRGRCDLQNGMWVEPQPVTQPPVPAVPATTTQSTSGTTSSTQSKTAASSSSNNAGAIAAIVIGVLVAVAAISLLGVYCYRRRQSSKVVSADKMAAAEQKAHDIEGCETCKNGEKCAYANEQAYVIAAPFPALLKSDSKCSFADSENGVQVVEVDSVIKVPMSPTEKKKSDESA